MRLREERNGDSRDNGHHRGGGGRGAVQQRFSSRVETSESEQEAASKYDSAVSEEREPVRQERSARREPPQRMARGQERGGGQGGGAELWECSTCTFHNKQSNTICEMCSKSRDLPPVVAETRGVELARDLKAKSATPPSPTPSGLVCGKCTLVNPPHAKICLACDCTLALPPIKSARKC